MARKTGVKFWCVIGTGKQMAFKDDGTIYEHDALMPVGEQHILLNDALLCNASRDSLKKSFNSKKQKTVQLRIENMKLCPKCERAYKANSSLSYQKWVVAGRGSGKSTMAFEEFCRRLGYDDDLHGVAQ